MKILLIDYKSKFTIAVDEDMVDDEWDDVLSETSKKQLLKEAEWRKETAKYFGIPGYIGKDEDLKKLFDK